MKIVNAGIKLANGRFLLLKLIRKFIVEKLQLNPPKARYKLKTFLLFTKQRWIFLFCNHTPSTPLYLFFCQTHATIPIIYVLRISC